MTQTCLTALIKRKDVSQFEWQALETMPLSQGQVRLDLSVYSLTTNNVTYAVMGEGVLGYWDFFPHTTDLSYGRLPVWGFGTVSESLCDGIEVGQRLYGYFPLAQSLVVEPSKITVRGFIDSSKAREHKSQVYNQYFFTDTDPSYDQGCEGEASVFRPLYGTGWWLSDLISLENDKGTIILTSASSKTALCTAYELKKQGHNLIGITSEKNLGFVRDLGLYDEVLTYDNIAQLKTNGSVCLVDYLGRKALIEQIDALLGAKITKSYLVGAADWQEKTHKSQSEQPYQWRGAKPQFFFAPSHIEKRMKEDRGLMQSLLIDQKEFCQNASRYCQIKTMTGTEEVKAAWADLIAAKTPPRDALVGVW
jgi:hypothetical protein